MIVYPDEYIESVALAMIQDGMSEEEVAMELGLEYESETEDD